VFRIDVAKVDRDVAHVTMAMNVCSKCIFQIFHMDAVKVDRDIAYAASILEACCKHFDMDVAYVSHILCCKSMF